MKDGNDIKKRFTDLATRAERTGSHTFTDFLNMNELAVFAACKNQPEFRGAVIFGGADGCERCMIRFGDFDTEMEYVITEAEGQHGDPEGSEGLNDYSVQEAAPAGFPISTIRISPVQAKFADDLTHRDFLGSVLGLGIGREKTGDIIISENTAYMFVHRDIAQFIVDSLEYVRHTHVRAGFCDELPENIRPKLERRQVIVSSNRIDAVISKLYNLSREQSLKLVSEGRVFVGGAEITSNSRALKTGDVVSVRGFGKWIFRGESGKTRKDRLYVEMDVYT
ncbi:MAG: hypothetical protein K6E62_12735 [Lachnospiraceae bacterium]|nr:hypothetical protein [Lachnospiraceae bacterium]